MQNKSAVFPRERPFSRIDAVFFAAAFVFLYCQLFQLPFTPIYFEGDNLVSVSNAIRMFDGEVIYRDFFSITPPGAELVFVAFFSVFGIKIWILNFVILLLGMAQVSLLWFFSRKTLSGIFIYLPTAIFLIVGFRLYGIDGTYRLFSVIGILAAVAVLFNNRSGRNLIIAGCFCGLASFFVQTRGVLGIVGIALFLIWENYGDGFDLKRLIKDWSLLTISFLLVVAVTQFYFAWQAGFQTYYFSLVEFLSEHYKNDPLAKTSSYFVSDLPDFQAFLNIYSTSGAVFRYLRIVAPALFFYLLIPFVYLGFFLYRWRNKDSLRLNGIDVKLMLLCVVGLILSLGVSAPSAARLYHVAIPGVVIFVWLVRQFHYSHRIAAITLAVFSVIGLSYVVQRQTVEKYYLDMPGGRAAFFSPQVFDRYDWIGQNTREGDVLFEAQHPSFYFPFHLKNPTPMSIMRDSDYTPQFQVDETVTALQKRAPNLVVWDGNWSKPVDARADGDHLEPLWQFIKSNYNLEVEYPLNGDYTLNSSRKVQIWRRKSVIQQ